MVKVEPRQEIGMINSQLRYFSQIYHCMDVVKKKIYKSCYADQFINLTIISVLSNLLLLNDGIQFDKESNGKYFLHIRFI